MPLINSRQYLNTFKHVTRLLLILLATQLVSCIAVPKGNQINLTEQVTLTLTAPPADKLDTLVSELVTVEYQSQQHRFIAQSQYRKDEIALVAVSVEGLPLFDFVWYSQKPAELNQYVPIANLELNYVIADMQLCHWPIAQLKQSLAGKQLEVIEIQSVDGWQRIFRLNNEVIIRINKTNDNYLLENLTRDYRIKLERLAKELL